MGYDDVLNVFAGDDGHSRLRGEVPEVTNGDDRRARHALAEESRDDQPFSYKIMRP